MAKREKDLEPYLRPIFRLSDDAYAAWFDNLRRNGSEDSGEAPLRVPTAQEISDQAKEDRKYRERGRQMHRGAYQDIKKAFGARAAREYAEAVKKEFGDVTKNPSRKKRDGWKKGG